MRLLVCALSLSGLVGLSHSLAIRSNLPSSPFAWSTDCPGTGEPGGVYIETTGHGKTKGKWRNASEATSCILKVDLLREVNERHSSTCGLVYEQRVTIIINTFNQRQHFQYVATYKYRQAHRVRCIHTTILSKSTYERDTSVQHNLPAHTYHTTSTTMRALTYIILGSSLTFVSLSGTVQRRWRSPSAEPHNARTCPDTGEPGGVYIEAQIGKDGLHVSYHGEWYSAEQGTKCVKKDDLLQKVVGTERAPDSSIYVIGPDRGGHCMVFHSDDCADQTGMPLDNPEGLPLVFKK
ncbi:uncharacterized protein CC84DRAFT_1175065 [Paraphaeosphaeria sporulosa]|uniref:Uncharacterized protein n=1 Tax=Paraphaeosphaeria sporulosa TaxID=1460663 RepID=A0A177CI82_9PLEO|nr:uncharacterized protein CC84DRAFT_1175065 [Paraphaeosphaeria sporulosa]OAG07215.1 hypothetical protein CC84DRAFT_1175065 [Paraphaeosphaeria sporulosa]